MSMDLTLVCHSCGKALTAATEDELVNLGQAHAVSHGHAPPRDQVLARVRRHNQP